MESKRLFHGWRIVLSGSVILFLGAMAFQSASGRLNLLSSQLFEAAEKPVFITLVFALLGVRSRRMAQMDEALDLIERCT